MTLEINTSLVKPLVPRSGPAPTETPVMTRARARELMSRMRFHLSAYGGIERSDFLDIDNVTFRHTVCTLWWGRQLA